MINPPSNKNSNYYYYITFPFYQANYANLLTKNKDVADVAKATDVRYLWTCNIKANYGVDIYTKLPERPTENPATSDINLFLIFGLFTISGLGLLYLKKYHKIKE